MVLNASSTAYTVTYNYATDGVFLAAEGSSQLTVNPATLTAAIVGNPTRTYDGTTDATLTSANFSLSGLVGPDSFTVTQTAGTYNSKDVTTATTVTAALAAADFTPGAGDAGEQLHVPHHGQRHRANHPRTADHHRQQRDDGIRRHRAAVDGVVRRVRRQ